MVGMSLYPGGVRGNAGFGQKVFSVLVFDIIDDILIKIRSGLLFAPSM